MVARLDRLEEQANHLRIPVAYASMLYELRNHIDLVSEGLKRHAETMKEEVGVRRTHIDITCVFDFSAWLPPRLPPGRIGSPRRFPAV